MGSLTSIERAILRGESVAQIARDHDERASVVKTVRNNLFARLDPVKMANGPLINAGSINRPKAARAAARVKPIQHEAFPPECDLGRTPVKAGPVAPA